MKPRSYCLVLVSLFTVWAAPAQARSLKPMVWTAELERFEIDPQLPQGTHVVAGAIRIDYRARQARLTLTRATSCRPGERCMRYDLQPLIVEAPIVASKTDDCGTAIIVAQADRRHIDVAAEDLIVRDNSHNHCPTFAKLPATEVEYRTTAWSRSQGATLRTRSTMSGGPLRAVGN